MKQILFTIAFTLIPLIASAQRIIGELESNADKRMIPGDSLDDDSKKKVPTEIYAWNIDDVYGNRTVTFVDTLHHLYQNHNLNEGDEGHYSHLGNLGTPRLNRVYMERGEGDEFFFINPFDQFYVPTSRFRFYNTKSPFLNADYNLCGDKQSGDSHIKITFTSNAGKRVNFGALFDYIYGEGYYSNQSTAHMGASAFASYIGDRYDFHFYYTHNHMKLAENGGIISETYITNPENQRKSYDSEDIPTLLSSTWGRQDHDVVHFNHRYNIGFTRTEGDSTNLKETFVPVTSIFHTFHLQNMKRRYIAYNTPEDYHTYTFLPGDSANDKTDYLQIKNVVGLSLREGFNKYAAAGLNAYVGFDHKDYGMIDSLDNGLFGWGKSKESSVLVGGQIIRTGGRLIHYNVDGEFIVAGDNAGDFKLKGHGELNLPVMKDTARVSVDAAVLDETPNYYLRHYHSKHAWWDNEKMERQFRTRIMGCVSLPKTGTTLTVGLENMKNYTYLADNGMLVSPELEPTMRYSHNINVEQCSDNIQIISVNLHQNFVFGPVHLDNDITYQKCSESTPLPLPDLSLYHNLYLKFKIAKVLNCELGGDVKYFTEYKAPTYSPVLGQFAIQNKENQVKIGNYPIISVYANFDLKRTRFYVQYYHVNQSDGRYLWAPGYPVNPRCLRFGISWNFYD